MVTKCKFRLLTSYFVEGIMFDTIFKRFDIEIQNYFY